jgi:hypothetical protein
VNSVYFAGRVHGHRLAPGVYLISISPNRSLVPGAPTEYVRVVSPRRALPLPDSAPKPSCTVAPASSLDPIERFVLAGTLPPATTSRPTARLAGAATPRPTGDENDDGAAGIPDSGVLGAATAGADEHPFVAIAVLALIGALLLAMLTLVTRFLRGSWNP